jgi:predicted nucleic acid-binding protein
VSKKILVLTVMLVAIFALSKVIEITYVKNIWIDPPLPSFVNETSVKYNENNQERVAIFQVKEQLEVVRVSFTETMLEKGWDITNIGSNFNIYQYNYTYFFWCQSFTVRLLMVKTTSGETNVDLTQYRKPCN